MLLIKQVIFIKMINFYEISISILFVKKIITYLLNKKIFNNCGEFFQF